MVVPFYSTYQRTAKTRKNPLAYLEEKKINSYMFLLNNEQIVLWKAIKCITEKRNSLNNFVSHVSLHRTAHYVSLYRCVVPHRLLKIKQTWRCKKRAVGIFRLLHQQMSLLHPPSIGLPSNKFSTRQRSSQISAYAQCNALTRNKSQDCISQYAT